MRPFSRHLAVGSLGLVLATACGSPEVPSSPQPAEEFAVIQRQALEESCYDRDNPLLQSLKTPLGARDCTFDEQCPQGAFCNESTHQCDWTCLEGGPAGTACGTGKVCDCSGQCVTEGGGNPLVLSGTLPRVDVAPAALSVTTPAAGQPFAARRLVVGLAALNPTEAARVASTPVRLVAGPGMEVACDVGEAPATVFSSDCLVNTWAFSAFGTGQRATVRMDVRPRQDSTERRWYVTLEAQGATPQRTRVDLDRADAAPGVGGVRPFFGNVTLTLDPSSDAGTEPLVLPVRAFANGAYLMLFDESRTLSPSGKLRLSTSQSHHGEEWLPAGNGSNTADAVTVDVEGTYDGTGASNSTLVGTFTVRLPRPISSAWGVQATYRLSRLRVDTDAGVDDLPLTACPATPCATGSVCEPDLGVCVPGVRAWSGAPVASGGGPLNTVVSEERASWDSEAQTRLTDFMNASAANGTPLSTSQLARGLLCNQATSATPLEVAGFPAFATADAGLPFVLARSGDLRCQNGGMPYVAELGNTWDRYPDVNGLKNLDRMTDLEMLSECLEDLKRPAVNGPGLGTSDWFAQRYGARYAIKTQRATVSTASRITPGRCFNLARFYGALNLSARDGNSRDQRLAGRLFQQWIVTHGYLAQQLVQQRELSDFLNEPAPSDWESTPVVLDRFEKGWDLLLDGTYANLMPGNDAARTCSILNPDYRLPPAPLASWTWATNQSVQDRGTGARWQRSRSTFFFHTPDLAARCTSTSSSVNLASASFLLGESPTGPRSLQVSCLQKTGGLEVTVQAARRNTPSGTRFFTWTLPFPTGTQGVAFAVLDQGATMSLISPAKTYLVPAQSTLAYEHAVLRPPYTQAVSGPSGTRLAVWDFVADTGHLSEAVDRRTLYDTPSADLAPMPGSQPHHDQPVGLPASILEGLTAHLRLLNTHLEDVERTTLATCAPVASGTPRDQAITRFGRTMRYAVMLETLARSAYAREKESCATAQGLTELPWDKRWRDAQAELEAVRRQSYEKLRAINDCRPYGMPDDEVPLLFGATLTGSIERYFGSSSYLHANATSAVNTAVGDKQAAESSWVSLRNGEVQEAYQGAAKQQRMLELKRQYGAPIVQMCGLTNVNAADALDLFDPSKTAQPLRPEACFVKPECQTPPAQVYAAVRTEHARFALCTWKRLVPSTSVYTDAAVRALVEHYTTVDVMPGSGTVTWGSTTLPVSRLYGQPLPTNEIASGEFAAARAACLQELGTQGSQLPTPSSLGLKLESSCYRGDMGNAMLSIVGANQGLQVAQAQWTDAQERLRIAQERCLTLETDTQKQIALSASYEAEMTGLLEAKVSVDRKVNNISDVNNKGESIISAFASGTYVGIAWGAVKLLSSSAENRYKDESIVLNARIQQLDLQHKLAVEALALQTNVNQCYAEARTYMVGISTAAMQIDRVGTDVDSALLQLENMEGRVRQLLLEGQQVVAQEEARQVPLFSHDFWLHERLTRARESFATAKRLSYLFARALEYEKQQSLPATSAVLAAKGPLQLQSALNANAYAALDKTVHGRDVEGQAFVVQLRGNVLKLEDLVAATPGERSLTKQERFTRRLLSPENAVYDDNGRYLGQGLRFYLQDSLGPNSIRCGEKVWTVHAHLVGDDRVETWLNGHGLAPLVLRKRNTFSSHSCDPDHKGFQTRALRPSLRSGGYTGTAKPGEETTFTLASVSANTGQTVLGFQQNPSGAPSTEWKGRGLYGEYEVIFPWVDLMTAGGVSTGFPMDGVTDVYLRFEQVSAATSHVYE